MQQGISVYPQLTAAQEVHRAGVSIHSKLIETQGTVGAGNECMLPLSSQHLKEFIEQEIGKYS